MKSYLTGLDIKKQIIKKLKEGEISLRKLETKLNIGYNSIKRHCEELEYLGIVKILEKKKNDKNGRPYKIVKLTDYGYKVL